jgi:hypothetical protein
VGAHDDRPAQRVELEILERDAVDLDGAGGRVGFPGQTGDEFVGHVGIRDGQPDQVARAGGQVEVAELSPAHAPQHEPPGDRALEAAPPVRDSGRCLEDLGHPIGRRPGLGQAGNRSAEGLERRDQELGERDDGDEFTDGDRPAGGHAAGDQCDEGQEDAVGRHACGVGQRFRRCGPQRCPERLLTGPPVPQSGSLLGPEPFQHPQPRHQVGGDGGRFR